MTTTTILKSQIPKTVTARDLIDNVELQKAFTTADRSEQYGNKFADYLPAGLRAKDDDKETLRRLRIFIPALFATFGASTQKAEQGDKLKTTIRFPIKLNPILQELCPVLDRMFGDALFARQDVLGIDFKDRAMFDKFGPLKSVERQGKDKKKAEEFGKNFTVRVEKINALFKKRKDGKINPKPFPIEEFQVPAKKKKGQRPPAPGEKDGKKGLYDVTIEVWSFHLGSEEGKITKAIPTIKLDQWAFEAKEEPVAPNFPGLEVATQDEPDLADDDSTSTTQNHHAPPSPAGSDEPEAESSGGGPPNKKPRFQ